MNYNHPYNLNCECRTCKIYFQNKKKCNDIIIKKIDPCNSHVYINATFTVLSVFQHLMSTNDIICQYFKVNNIVFLPPNHYNIANNLIDGGINISSTFERRGQVTLKVKARLPIAIYYNKNISGIKTDLNILDIKTLVLNNNTSDNIVAGAYKGFTKQALSTYLNLPYHNVIYGAVEDINLFDYPTKLAIINSFKNNKSYVFLPKILVDLGYINTDSTVGVATLNTLSPDDPTYPLIIDGLHIEFNKNVSERTKNIASSLAKILLDYFGCD